MPLKFLVFWSHGPSDLSKKAARREPYPLAINMGCPFFTDKEGRPAVFVPAKYPTGSMSHVRYGRGSAQLSPYKSPVGSRTRWKLCRSE
jgi:hypothetical protein